MDKCNKKADKSMLIAECDAHAHARSINHALCQLFSPAMASDNRLPLRWFVRCCFTRSQHIVVNADKIYARACSPMPR